MILSCYFDGGNEKDLAAYGFIAKMDDKFITAQMASMVPKELEQTNNVAEWSALLAAAVYCWTQIDYYDEFILKGDSQLVVRQATGEYVVKAPHLIDFYNRFNKIQERFKASGKILKLEWIRREHNSLADLVGREIRNRYLTER